MSESVLIVGAGQGLSESLARLCVSKNIKVALAAEICVYTNNNITIEKILDEKIFSYWESC